MQVLNDPRIPFYFNANGQTDDEGDPEYIGYDNGGASSRTLQNVRARLGAYAVGTSGAVPQRLLTYFQTQFMLAEASLTPGYYRQCPQYFENALNASYE
jgi:hypothetical protein